jgi:hypothetical protein
MCGLIKNRGCFDGKDNSGAGYLIAGRISKAVIK